MVHTKRDRERGQSLVETAISFTILLLLLGGAVDFGRAFFSYIAVHDAAQEGATYGALFPDATDVEMRVRASATQPIDLSNTSDVSIATSKSCAGSTYTVTVTYNFIPVMPLTNTIIGSSGFPLHATVKQTILSDECTGA